VVTSPFSAMSVTTRPSHRLRGAARRGAATRQDDVVGKFQHAQVGQFGPFADQDRDRMMTNYRSHVRLVLHRDLAAYEPQRRQVS